MQQLNALPLSRAISLDAVSNHEHSLAELDAILLVGGSVWTINSEEGGLVRRVDPTSTANFIEATKQEDSVSAELLTAWSACFGRSPDPSDAWDHATKALEAALIPLIVPTQAKPQLGHVLGVLESRPHDFELILVPIQKGRSQLRALEERQAAAIETLASMLRLVWPNPDRTLAHSGGHPPRKKPKL